MHANIIDGSTKEERAAYVAGIATGLTNLVKVETEKTSITIKQVQELVTSLTTQSPIPRIVWIEEANLMTPPAQNALLKSLEEPPSNTTFYLTTELSRSLLPTIRSRATTMHLKNESATSADPHLPLIKEAMSATLGNRLQMVSNIPTDRAEALVWIAELLKEIEVVLQKTTARPSQLLLTGIAKNAFAAHARLKSNCSVSLSLQNFLLHLPKTNL